MTRKSLINQDGSITVEAAVIVPVVIIAVMIVLYIVLIIFQTCMMQVVANNISERAAAIWLNQYSAFETGETSKQEIEKLGLYRRWNFNNSYNEGELKDNAADMLQGISILRGKNIKVDIKHQNTVLSNKIVVKLSASYSNPLGGLTGTWGLGRSMQLRVQSQAVVDDPVEFIRNSDFIIETASDIPLIGEFEGKWNDIVSRIVKYINSLSKGEKASSLEKTAGEGQ